MSGAMLKKAPFTLNLFKYKLNFHTPDAHQMRIKSTSIVFKK